MKMKQLACLLGLLISSYFFVFVLENYHMHGSTLSQAATKMDQVFYEKQIAENNAELCRRQMERETLVHDEIQMVNVHRKKAMSVLRHELESSWLKLNDFFSVSNEKFLQACYRIAEYQTWGEPW